MSNPLKILISRAFKNIETRAHELNYLFWECTTRCNLNCLHCGSDCSKSSSHKDMPLNDFLAALDTIKKKANHFIVVLTGGEPLLRQDIEECGRQIRSRGIRWGLVTNGHLLSRTRYISLLNAGMGALTVSLDGMKGSHNWLRNTDNSHALVSNAIDLALSSTRLNFDVVSCINKNNIDELDEIYHFLYSKGVPAWRLFTIAPIGRAAMNNDLQLSNNQFRKLLDFISKKRKEKGMDIKFSCEGYLGPYELKVRDSYFFCRAGINIGSILIDGSISSCPNIDRSFAQGNIYSDNFYEVWQNRFEPFRKRGWTKVGQCKECKEYNKCLGNGMHYWHGSKSNVLVCHKDKITGSTSSTIAL